MKIERLLLLVGLLGLFLLAMASLTAAPSIALIRHGAVQTGKVLDVKERRYTDHRGHSARLHTSTISFNGPNGVSVTFRQEGDYGRGNDVEVIFDPHDLTSVRVRSFSSMWGKATTLGCGGLLFALVGFGGWTATRSRTR